MAYVLTGATGFIGRHLLECLAVRGETVYCLVRPESEERLAEIAARVETPKARIVPLEGDLLQPMLGLGEEQIAEMRGHIDHFFHLAALRDLSADSEELARCNVGGTRAAIELAAELEAGCFHHMSTVAVAGRYQGTFTEAMLEQAEQVHDPYASTKHQAERLVRTEYTRPFRIYRPSVVIGHSRTGETDRADGLYYLFPIIRRLRDSLPAWLPRFGIESESLNVVPVDFVVRALDHIAHAKELDGRTFHLIDPEPRRASEVIDTFCRAAGAPPFSAYVRLPVLPDPVLRLLDASGQLPPVRRASDALLADLGIPRRLLSYLGTSTEYACDEARSALAGSGIEVPALERYAARVWRFWEEHFASMPARSPRLARAVDGKRVLITGACGRLETELALRVAASGGHAILVDDGRKPLETLRHRITGIGGRASIRAADVSDRKAVARLLEQLARHHEEVDVLIHTSEALPDGAVGMEAASVGPFEHAFDAQYLAPLELILGVVAGMRRRGAGHVVLLSELRLDRPGDPAYTSTTAALDAFGSSVADDLAADGVALTSVHLPPLAPPDDGDEEVAATDERANGVSLERAAEVVCEALVRRPRRASTLLGTTSELARTAAPETYARITSLLARARRGADAAMRRPA